MGMTLITMLYNIGDFFPVWRDVDSGCGYYYSTLTFDLEADALKKKQQLEFVIEHKKKLSKKTVISYTY